MTNGPRDRKIWYKNYTIGTPLVELNPFIECLDILHTCSRVLGATFDQLMKRLRKKKFFWTGLVNMMTCNFFNGDAFDLYFILDNNHLSCKHTPCC